MGALNKIRAAGFAIGLTEAGDIAITPAPKLTQRQREFLKSHKAALVQELKAEPLTPDEFIIINWLTYLGEKDQTIIDEILERCRADPDELAHFLIRARAKETNSDTFITCRTCKNFQSFNQHGGGSGFCQAHVQPNGILWWADTRHQCYKHFKKT
jgi:hypothetical protein